MKNILVTGATGTFGQAFVSHILNDHKVERIVVYSRGEHLQEEMARKFKDDRLRYFIGDIRDLDRLEMAMKGIDTVIHAAALKIVPTAEYNPTECIATNVTGAENVVKAALRTGVRTAVALSTDKVCHPINLYGASKLAAEKIFVAANALSAGGCHFNVVRYGNVSGSRGSVLPFFKRLAAEGKALPVTDERMTRFWISLEQAIELVIAATGGTGFDAKGKILVPRIPSVRIVDLANAISNNIALNTGIRPGEKIHETLITEDEAKTTGDAGGLYIIHPQGYEPINKVKEGFRYSSDTNEQWLTVEQLRELVK